jgi:hypothetical protein
MARASLCCIIMTSREHKFGHIAGQVTHQSVVLAPPLCDGKNDYT